MSNPFRRLMTVLKAKFSRLVGRAENPHDLLDYSYEQQVEQLRSFREGLASLATAKRRVANRKSKLEDDVRKLGDGAKLALEQGDEEAARKLLERKQFLANELSGIDREVADLEARQANMIDQEKALQVKVERFRTSKEVSKAEYAAAQAQVTAGEALAGFASADNEAGMALERAQEKVENMKARAEALVELEEAGAFTDVTGSSSSVDREIDKLTAGVNVEAELQKLKSEVAGEGEVADASSSQ